MTQLKIISPKKGFTLIEVIVVIMIMALFSAIAIPNYKKIQVKAKEAAIQSIVTTLHVAIESYYISNGIYPKTSNNISEVIQTLISDKSLKSQLINPFTKKTFNQTDNSGKITYQYINESDDYNLIGYGYKNEKTIINKEAF